MNFTSPLLFKNVKNIVPFNSTSLMFSKTQDASIGTDLGLYNLLTLDVTLKVGTALPKVGGIKLKITGRTLSSESTTAAVLDGLLNGEQFDENVVLSDIGKYRIQYDISSIREGWIWLIPNIIDADVKVTDVCDIRISIQNSNNLLPKPTAHPQVVFSHSTPIGGGIARKIDVREVKSINLKINTYGEGSGYYELYVNGKNTVREVKGLMLYNKDGSELDSKSFSTSLNGYLWRVYNNTTLDLVLDVTDFDSINLAWLAKGDASTTIPYDMLFLKDDTAFDKVSNIAYNSKSFVLEKCRAITDCYWDTFIINNSTSISISPNGIDGNYKEVLFTSDNFPNLKEDSKIKDAWVLPYNGTSRSQNGNYARICIVSDKGQIYHNYPVRVPSNPRASDIYLFDESVIWDLPIGKTTRRHPSKDINENRIGYRYDPTLLDYGYEMKPALNQDNGYGNGGFDATIGTGDMTRPRFYQFQEPTSTGNIDADVDSPFALLSPPCKLRKSTFIGTYQINRSRVCLFSTNDGGRNWFVEYEFSSGTSESSVGYGNDINTTNIGAYIANSFSVQKRNYVYPTNEVKEPENKFSYDVAITISSISNEASAIVTTATAHGLKNKDVVILVKNDSATTPFDFMANTPSLNDGGTGILYMVKVINTTQFYLKEFIYSPDNNLTCRHIHYVQELKDFIAFGTGELYPNGWSMLLDQRAKDAYWIVNPVTKFNEAYRLNSSENGIQRLCSFWMNDDDSENPTVYLGSDDVNVVRPSLKIAGRTDLPMRSSAGIYKGKLSDIDDFGKFYSVLDVGDVNIYCKNLNGVLVAGFQMGHCAVSFDGGDTWEIINMGSMLLPVGADRTNTIYFKTGLKLRIK